MAVTPIVRDLFDLLADLKLLGQTRGHAETLLLDLLRAVSVAAIRLPMPADQRALVVAEHIKERPTDQRGLHDWGRVVGASPRTLSRLFAEETGLTFVQWRTNARLRVALTKLACGDSIASAAFASGYSTASAFTAAFRRVTGQTPGAHFRNVEPV